MNPFILFVGPVVLLLGTIVLGRRRRGDKWIRIEILLWWFGYAAFVIHSLMGAEDESGRALWFAVGFLVLALVMRGIDWLRPIFSPDFDDDR